jgi:hypothetical protein
MEYRWFAEMFAGNRRQLTVQSRLFAKTYHIRIYKDKGKLQLQSLKRPPGPISKYLDRMCVISNFDGTNSRQIIFYMDDVSLKHEKILEIAHRICAAMDW